MGQPIAPVRRGEGSGGYRWDGDDEGWQRVGRMPTTAPAAPPAARRPRPSPRPRTLALAAAGLAAAVLATAAVVNAAPDLTAVRAEPAAAAPLSQASAPAPAVPFAPQTAAGRGDAVVPITVPDDAGPVVLLTLTHTGEGPFIAWTNPGDAATRLVANVIGGFDGTLLVPSTTTAVGLTADGTWTLTVAAPEDAPGFTGLATGTDSGVLRATAAGAVTLEHAGAGMVSLWAYPEGSATGTVLATISGTSTAAVDAGTEPVLLVVAGSGDWTVRRP